MLLFFTAALAAVLISFKGEPRSNLFRVFLKNHFKQLIGNLSLLCAFKMLSCRNFVGP